MIDLNHYQELVSVEGDKLVTLSIKVADIHKSNTATFCAAFAPCTLTQQPANSHPPILESQLTPMSGAKQIPCYTITKDGYTLRAMGYTGEAAMAFRPAKQGRRRA
jgi:hypothetical protein